LFRDNVIILKSKDRSMSKDKTLQFCSLESGTPLRIISSPTCLRKHYVNPKKVGDECIFQKSGNIVTILSLSGNHKGQKMWTVKRNDTDKKMVVPDCALSRIYECCRVTKKEAK